MIVISTALPLALIAGVVLDRVFGEPHRFHPLVGFGYLANAMESWLRRGEPGHPVFNRLRGLLAWLLLIVPCVALSIGLCLLVCHGLMALFDSFALNGGPLSALAGKVLGGWRSEWAWIADAVLLYFALGTRSLVQHGERVAHDLAANDLHAARQHVGWMVSRDTSQLDEQGVSRAAVESILENGNDAVFGTLFWFCVAGGPGAVMFRLANTLDAMWGYKDTRRIYFGWAAARIDDVLNFIPARLTALTYALLGKTRSALKCWLTQAAAWESPNAGPVIAAGAGAIGVTLGGVAMYHGQSETRPKVGAGNTARPADIERAIALVVCGQSAWLMVIAGLSLLSFLYSQGKFAFA
ncbi:MAG: cobalamin biosynthesis protein CobD [Rhodocyclales bacterium]|jgi:adenosylcobinamide-phosphate synthase|nr:cobalamin biosynthesis protein CobD [Rhodocyclales bacterium]